MSVGSARSSASGEVGTPVAHQYVVVQPGQTLWSIAGEADPGRDRRAVVEDILELNGLRGQVLQAGTRIALP